MLFKEASIDELFEAGGAFYGAKADARALLIGAKKNKKEMLARLKITIFEASAKSAHFKERMVEKLANLLGPCL